MSPKIKKLLPFAALAAALLIGVASFNFLTKERDSAMGDSVPVGEPIDAVSDFYSFWLGERRANLAESVLASLATSTTLSEALRRTLADAVSGGGALDPVMCQEVLPERFGMKVSYEQERAAQYLVLPRGGETKSASVAVVDLAAVDGAWQIINISCSTGETGPVREFSFERDGFLLKSVPAPLNAEYWHLVFEENGTMGHTAPLFFSAESICVYADGSEVACDTSRFVDALPATVKGSMTEAGVEVVRVEVRG